MNCGIYCIDRTVENTVAQMIDKAVFAQQTIDSSSTIDYCYYDNKSLESILRTADIESKMEGALKSGEFCIYLQPKYNVIQSRIDSSEALVRWKKPDGSVVFPDQFIPIFEKNVFIAELDKFVMDAACKLIKRCHNDGKPIIPISVNVSRATAAKEDFIDYYVETKRKYGIGDNFIELEFTESMAMDSYELLEKKMIILKKNGFRCSIDDFGEGFSSFKALKNLPFDELKLDKSFLKRSSTPQRDQLLIAGVVAMAQALNMKVVMEGVETPDEYASLKRIGVDVIQGYIYARPMPVDEYVAFVTNAYAGKDKKDMLEIAADVPVSPAVRKLIDASGSELPTTEKKAVNNGTSDINEKPGRKTQIDKSIPVTYDDDEEKKDSFEAAGQYSDELGESDGAEGGIKETEKQDESFIEQNNDDIF